MAKRISHAFKPQLLSFEDRITPANYYVDNAFAGKANGTVVTFNAGQTNQVTNLTIGTDAFASFGDAITKANGTVGVADTINFANGTFTVDQAANAGAFKITDALSFVGSGKTVTVLKSVSDTVDASGTNGALFVAQNTSFNASNLTLDGDSGNGKLTASGFRYESSTGTVTNSTLQNVGDFSSGTSVGYPIVVTDAGSNVTISGNSIVNNGRGGVRFDNGAKGTVQSNTIQGRGGNDGNAINYGVEISNSSDALVTGNTITGFLGAIPLVPGPGFSITSAAVFVSGASNANVFGNTLSTNNTGVIVGSGADTSTANIQFNNIINNDNTDPVGGSGVFTSTTGTVTALNNFWGTPAGPQAPDNAGGTDTSSVTAGVTYKDATITQPPNGIATGTLPVQVATSAGQAGAGASPSVTITGPATPATAPINLTVTFTEAMTGFDKTDVVLSGTAGTGTVTSVTTADNKTFTVTVAGLNKRGTLTANIAAGAATSTSTGLGNVAGTANIAFQPVLDRGFAVSGDSGIVTPVFGVPDTFTPTRFNNTVFGAGFTGGNRVATADVNGDGTLDYIVGSGGGVATQVRVFNGLTNLEITTNASILNPFGTSFTRGAYVSAGDLTGDGLAEIVISAERGGGARVRIFSPNAAGVFTQLNDFIGLIGGTGQADTSFRGGSRTAIGDFNGDGTNDLVFAAGTGGGPRIALFNGLTIATTLAKLRGDFFIFEPSLRNGSYVAAGDVNGDGKAELIGGAGNGASRLRVFDGVTLLNTTGNPASISDYFAFSNSSGGGVRVAAEDLDGDGKVDVIAGEGPGTGSRVRVYSATNIINSGAIGTPPVTQELSLFGAFTGGVFVG